MKLQGRVFYRARGLYRARQSVSEKGTLVPSLWHRRPTAVAPPMALDTRTLEHTTGVMLYQPKENFLPGGA